MIDTDNNNNNKQYININEKILRLKNVKKGRYKINKNDAQINNIIMYLNMNLLFCNPSEKFNIIQYWIERYCLLII